MAGKHFTNRQAKCMGESHKILKECGGLHAMYPRLGR